MTRQTARAAPAVRIVLCWLVAGSALAVPADAVGQGAGSTASTVLRLAPSPRALALGGAMAAVEDAFAVEFNPAALRRGTGRLAASFQTLPLDIAAGAAALGFDAPGGAAALSLRFVDYGEVEVVEEGPGTPVGVPTGGTATGGELTALAGYAIALGPLRLGVAGRWLRVEVAGLRDDAFAADVGALLQARHGLALGVAVQNLGTEVEAGRAAPLPVTVRAGLSARRDVGPVDALLALEARRREERNGAGVGLEIGAGGPALRAEARVGWESRAADDAYSRFVFGGGIRLDRIAVAFGYRALGPLGSTRQFGISYTF